MPTDVKVLFVIRVSYMEAGFKPGIVIFRLFLFSGNFFMWDKMVQNDVMRATFCMWRVREGSPCHRWGCGGPPPVNFLQI